MVQNLGMLENPKATVSRLIGELGLPLPLRCRPAERQESAFLEGCGNVKAGLRSALGKRRLQR